jgi:endo-1,4-beta-xylanase
VTPTAPAGSACRVTYTTSDWNTGFTASVHVANTGTTAITGWKLTFAFTAGQVVTNGWSATFSQSGSAVTATNAAWNGTIAPGGSVDVGFNGSHTGANPRPASFALNGTTCG